MTKTQKMHMDRIASMPCACCGCYGVHVHHIRQGQGMSQRASDFLTVPLCPDCHQGSRGVHGDKSIMRTLKLDELGMLAKTIEGLYQ